MSAEFTSSKGIVFSGAFLNYGHMIFIPNSLAVVKNEEALLEIFYGHYGARSYPMSYGFTQKNGPYKIELPAEWTMDKINALVAELEAWQPR